MTTQTRNAREFGVGGGACSQACCYCFHGVDAVLFHGVNVVLFMMVDIVIASWC